MDTSGLHRHLPSQATARNRELAERMLRGKVLSETYKDAAIEQLSTIPEPWLDRLHSENVAYVGLGHDDTLADTEILRNFKPEQLHEEAGQAQPLRQKVEDEVDAEIAKIRQETPESADFAQHSRPDEVAKKLGLVFAENQLGFQVKVQRGSTPLEYLHNEYGIADDPAHEYIYPDGSNEEARETRIFRSLLTELNGKGVLKDGDMVDPDNDVLIVPYKITGEKRTSPVLEASLKSFTGLQMDNNHGANIWSARLIMVDDEVANIPSRKMGYHSVLLHESGHAIDYAAESVPELDHRATVDRLYANEIQRYQSGDNRFLTPRASENVREYFAEAVEAYLTKPLPNSNANFYKQENNHEMLKERNPELFAYVDKLMRWQGTGQTGESAA